MILKSVDLDLANPSENDKKNVDPDLVNPSKSFKKKR
jgi:hypothetical protein